MNKINFKIPVTFFKEGDMFIAYTPVLDLSTAAKTLEGARKRFSEAVNIFFKEIKKMGTLDKVLMDLGWQKTEQQWEPMVPIAHEMQEFQVTH